MVKITASEDCDNSPKKKYVLDFLIASAEGNISSALDLVSEDITLVLVGRKSVRGKASFKEIFLGDADRTKVNKLTVENILSHGKRCAANGTLRFEDGSKVAFNNVYTFDGFGKSAKLQNTQVYSIVL